MKNLYIPLLFENIEYLLLVPGVLTGSHLSLGNAARNGTQNPSKGLRRAG